MQKNASLPDLAGVAAVVLAIRPGGWGEKYPGFVRVGRGIGNAHALRGVGRTSPKSAAALGGYALFRADGWLAKLAKFHGGSNKKARLCGLQVWWVQAVRPTQWQRLWRWPWVTFPRLFQCFACDDFQRRFAAVKAQQLFNAFAAPADVGGGHGGHAALQKKPARGRFGWLNQWLVSWRERR